MQSHDALPHARAGLLFTISVSLLSWERDPLYDLFPELPLLLLSYLTVSRFVVDQMCAEVSGEFPLLLDSFL